MKQEGKGRGRGRKRECVERAMGREEQGDSMKCACWPVPPRSALARFWTVRAHLRRQSARGSKKTPGRLYMELTRMPDASAR